MVQHNQLRFCHALNKNVHQILSHQEKILSVFYCILFSFIAFYFEPARESKSDLAYFLIQPYWTPNFGNTKILFVSFPPPFPLFPILSSLQEGGKDGSELNYLRVNLSHRLIE
jgi:hypothetical protein